jgi:hypothetical protein
MLDKSTWPVKRIRPEDGIRVVPGGSSIRDGCYIGKGVVCMPPMFINAGSWVGDGTIIDSHALVGSCAQIGSNCHISAAVAIVAAVVHALATPVRGGKLRHVDRRRSSESREYSGLERAGGFDRRSRHFRWCLPDRNTGRFVVSRRRPSEPEDRRHLKSGRLSLTVKGQQLVRTNCRQRIGLSFFIGELDQERVLAATIKLLDYRPNLAAGEAFARKILRKRHNGEQRNLFHLVLT